MTLSWIYINIAIKEYFLVGGGVVTSVKIVGGDIDKFLIIVGLHEGLVLSLYLFTYLPQS